jgi:hypothetical protein
MCSDPFVTLLESFGYCVARTPSANLAPLQLLLGTSGELDVLGPLVAVVTPVAGGHPPAVRRDRPAPTISGRRTGTLDVAAGLSLLAAVVSAMGGSRLGLDDTYRAADTVTFEFSDVTEDSVELVDLDRFLADGRVTRASLHVASLLKDDALSVTTAVVKSRTLTVEARTEDGIGVTVDVPALQRLAGSRLAVTQSSSSSEAVVYTGSVPLGFGFRAVKLLYDHGRYNAFAPIEPGAASVRGPRREYLKVAGLVALCAPSSV